MVLISCLFYLAHSCYDLLFIIGYVFTLESRILNFMLALLIISENVFVFKIKRSGLEYNKLIQTNSCVVSIITIICSCIVSTLSSIGIKMKRCYYFSSWLMIIIICSCIISTMFIISISM